MALVAAMSLWSIASAGACKWHKNDNYNPTSGTCVDSGFVTKLDELLECRYKHTTQAACVADQKCGWITAHEVCGAEVEGKCRNTVEEAKCTGNCGWTSGAAPRAEANEPEAAGSARTGRVLDQEENGKCLHELYLDACFNVNLRSATTKEKEETCKATATSGTASSDTGKSGVARRTEDDCGNATICLESVTLTGISYSYGPRNWSTSGTDTTGTDTSDTAASGTPGRNRLGLTDNASAAHMLTTYSVTLLVVTSGLLFGN